MLCLYFVILEGTAENYTLSATKTRAAINKENEKYLSSLLIHRLIVIAREIKRGK